MATAWWSAPTKQERLALAVQMANGLRDRQHRSARARAEAALFLYRGSRRLRLNGSDTGYVAQDWDETPPHNNIIATAIDWFTSIMLRNRVRPFYLTTRGNAKDKEKAQILQRATEGTMNSLGLYGELGRLRARDGHTFRAGGVKYAVDPVGKRIVASRVRSWECWVPEREARLGFPRQMTHGQLVPREVLLSMVEPGTDAYRAIEEVQPEPLDVTDQLREDFSELILVQELWHLPSGEVNLDDPKVFGRDDNGDKDEDEEPEKGGMHDGRRMLCIQGTAIADEPWPYSYFPISWYRPFREPVGFWSQGIPEIIGGAHIALLEMADSVQQYLRWLSTPHLIVYDKAKINNLTLNNDPSKIWTSRVPPSQAVHTFNPSAVPGELLQREGQIIAWAKERLGVSDMSLFAEKPKGVDHAPGMEHLSEMENIRHTDAFQEWERTHVTDANIITDCYYTLARTVGDFEVQAFGDNKELVKFNWKQMNMKRAAFTCTVFPTNYFAITPTARFRQVKEMGQAGMFNGTPQARMQLRAMGYPDIESIIGDQVAMEANIERCLDAAAKGAPDEEWVPHPYMDLELAKQRARDRISRMEADEENPESIDRVVTFYELSEKLSMQQGPTAGPMTETGPMPPGASGMPEGPPMTAPPGAPIQ